MKGNPMTPCPCCTRQPTGDWFDLCEPCLRYALSGANTANCPHVDTPTYPNAPQETDQ